MAEYQVIARKWRPAKFSDVVGQQHVVRTLLNAIESKRTAHAYLFVGPRGVGKTTLARIFAKVMNCLDDRNGEPCCECESCRAIFEERSLDVIEVDAASRNSTNDMRELSEDVLTRPSSGRYKIYIIDEVHMLSKAAWNVLLKTVEEPPEHVKFIFATTEVHQVLPTIISRCQRFDLLPIPTKLISERLKLIAETEHVNLDDNAINAIARAAEGGMRDAQSLLDQMIAYFSMDGQQITEQQVLSLFGLTNSGDLELLLESMIRNKPADVVSVIGALAKRGKNLETLFDDLLSMLRAVHLCSIMPDPSDLLDESQETIARWKQIALTTDRETLQILLETVSPVGRVLHDALNKQVYLETILLKAMREAHAVRVSDILNRLNQLRGAGELKFLDTLPAAVRENAPVQPSEPVDIKSRMSAPEESGDTAISEPVKAVEPPKPEIKPEPVSETPVEIKPEPVSETPVEIKPEPVVGTVEVERTFDEPDPEEVLATQIKVQPKPAVQVTEPAEETVMIMDDDGNDPAAEDIRINHNLDNSVIMEKLAEENNSKLLAPESKKPRRSIINDSVNVKREISDDPEVAEILELFGGDVVDVHR
ncbi:MAG: DNA polymerase III subunit gamma/tau [Lentisphaeria bacterium]|nr:DNA polymerase III subunit gamma/tau [Lentisphaeria bacterium]